MPNLNQYIKEATDTMNATNYNELDALVLSQLSYQKFEDMDKDFSGMTVQEYAKELLKTANPEQKDNYMFLTQIAESERYKNCTMSNFQAENDNSQWAAITINMNDGSDTAVIAFRGTDGTTLGWDEDFQLVYDVDGTQAQHLSAEYLKNCDASNVYLTGHSKGGNDAMSAYIMNDAAVREKVIQIDNFDGPGFNEDMQLKYSEGYTELDNVVNNYYPENSVIGKLLVNEKGNTSYIEADITGHTENMWIIGEHDPYSWQIDDQGAASFQKSEQTELSDYIDSILDDTIAGMSNDERKNLYNVISKFGIPGFIASEGTPFSDNPAMIEKIVSYLDNTGYFPKDFLKGLSDEMLVLANIIEGGSILAGMSREQRQTIYKTISALLVNSLKKVIIESMESLIEDIRKRLEEKYRKIADVIIKVRKKIADALYEFTDRIQESVEYIIDSAKEIFDNFIDWITGRTGSGKLGHANFEIHLECMQNICDDLERIKDELDALSDEVHRVKRQLSGVLLRKFSRKINNLEKQLSEESKDCNEMSIALEKVSKCYQSTENKIFRMGC